MKKNSKIVKDEKKSPVEPPKKSNFKKFQIGDELFK
jgi:hypothetical protein